MCVFFRFRVVVGVYPYIISSIYRPAMTLASIDRRPSNRFAWKEGERARPAQLKAVDQRIRAGTDAIRHLSNDAGRFPHQSAQVSPPARLEPSDSSGRSRKRAEGKKKEKHAIQWFRERARNCTQVFWWWASGNSFLFRPSAMRTWRWQMTGSSFPCCLWCLVFYA